LSIPAITPSTWAWAAPSPTFASHERISALLRTFAIFPKEQESDHVAEVQLLLGASPADWHEDLFHQIQRRHTTKDLYENAAIKPFTLNKIEKSINLSGIYHNYLDDKDVKAKIADLVSRSHQIQLVKKEFRHNLGE
jgi:hypothetical protein